MSMQLRKLGRTNIKVGVLGLGTEYFHGVPRETVVSVMREAVEAGINYFDLLWPYPEYLDNLGVALRGLRDRVTLAVHVGCVDDNGQARRSRDIAECTAAFEERLTRLRIDHADIAMVHNVDEEDDYRAVAGPGGLLELALRFKQQGKARFIAISSHRVPIAQAAIHDGRFDAVMFPVNPAFDALGGEIGLEAASALFGEDAGQARGDRRRLYEQCTAKNTGLIAMKPYAGGRFFRAAGPNGETMSPIQLLSYAASRPGVSAVVPGVKGVQELHSALEYLTASEEEKGFGPALAGSSWVPEGSCVYCNHCLPCPSGIDIGRTLRLAGAPEHGLTQELRADAASLPASPSDCVECGDCVERCPFGVAVIEEMKKASEALEG
jgi:predicted aldo/keto reductase-like oxidoreductase